MEVKETLVVEEAPSHNSIRCVTAWMNVEPARPVVNPEEFFAIHTYYNKRPHWSIQIFDTTQADDPEHLERLAALIYKETREERQKTARRLPDRIEVWGMPLPDATEEERIEKCKAHFLDEVKYRKDANTKGFNIPSSMHDEWLQAIVIIDRSEELWDEGEGGFLAAYWDMNPSYLEALARHVSGPMKGQPTESKRRFTRAELGGVLAYLRFGLVTIESEEELEGQLE